MTDIANIFERGGDAAEVTAAENGGGRTFRRTVYRPKMTPGSQIVIRYLLDYNEIFHTTAHQGVKTMPKPADWPEGRNYPSSMGAVCRYDKQFKKHNIFSDCPICDHKMDTTFGGGGFATPKARVYSLAVLREEVFGTPEMAAQEMIPEHKIGKVVGFTDKKRTVSLPKLDADGNEVKGSDGKVQMYEIEEPEVVVINEAMGTWFTHAKQLYSVYGTLCDRDYVVRQEGKERDVSYPHVSMAETPNLQPGTPLWKERYIDPLAAMGESFSIPHIIMGQASDEYYGRFFDPSKAPKSANKTSSTGAPAAQQQAAPSNDVDKDRLAEIKNRIMNQGASAGTAPAAFDAV